MLIDTHCHLNMLDLEPYDGNLQAAINAAVGQGVEQILSISVDLKDMDLLHSYTQRDGVFASSGVHPLHKEGLLKNQDKLVEHAQKDKVVAIGETGLDYFYEDDKSVHLAQQESFALHLSAAGQLNMPVIVHTRQAKQDTLSLIREHGNTSSAGVLHCFTEDYQMAKAALDLNYMISISGIVTFKTAQELRETVQKLPLDALLIETDSPYLAPVPHRGKKNEPKYVKDVAQFVADIKGVRYEELVATTAANFHRLCPKVDPHNRLAVVS
ncbi:TatD family hydrolase [Marinomonas epiphytica]